MCTLIVLHRCVDGAPLVAAANRDEFFDRPAEGPALRRAGAQVMLAPSDLRAGGTWLGLNGGGVFAAVTNRRCQQPDPARRSRGLLVSEALEASSAAAAAEVLGRLPEAAYNPFNLLVADDEKAFAVVYEDAARVFELAPGAHVLGGGDPDSTATPKAKRLLQRAEQVVSAPADRLLELLAQICRDHRGTGDPLQDTCVHTPRYGTRSSTLLRRATDESQRFFGYSDGPPCTTGYDDLTPLLRELDRRTGYVAGTRTTRKKT